MSIKSFVYLDENKMYSLSSQLFEGITQYILEEDSNSKSEENSQKGQFISGRFMADMIMQKNTKSEMKHLHDFAYSLFEKELISRNLLFEVTKETNITDLRDKGFIKIKGKVIFEDYAKILSTLEHFNTIGRAIGELSFQDTLKQLKTLADTERKTNDREKKNKIHQVNRQLQQELDKFLIENGLMIEENSRSNIFEVLNFGYHDNYEIRLTMDESNVSFTAIIDKENLKDSQQTLISKYSRLSEKEFSIIGMVTQCGNDRANIPDIEGNDMKKATINLIEKIDGLEEMFNGRTANECIIDPIAIYTEV